MLERWTMHAGDAPGQTQQMDVAASLATLVDPALTALRIERANELRTDSSRVVYMINPHCIVRGIPEATTSVRALLLDEQHPLRQSDPHHPALDCLAGILNARALILRLRKGARYRLEHSPDSQRTHYVSGDASALVANVETIATPSVAKAAALGLLGMPLYNITGTQESPLFIVHRWSQGMLDESGDPVTYDAQELILGEENDWLDLDHPYMLAYRARKNYERLNAEVAKVTELLILTPDLGQHFGHRGTYDPEGMHAFIDPNASGDVWDKIEKDFFG
jgi:hypothetical protein